jgi:hypothetical protein
MTVADFAQQEKSMKKNNREIRDKSTKPPHGWRLLASFAGMNVWVSGGPIHAPHGRMLQLLVSEHGERTESWTIYRHETSERKNGKLVHKRWDRAKDRKKFLAMAGKQRPKDWYRNTSIVEKQLVLPAKWVRDLDDTLATVSVPLIAGQPQALYRRSRSKLNLWRGDQESLFEWDAPVPAAWEPLDRLFSSMVTGLSTFRNGGALEPVRRMTRAL